MGVAQGLGTEVTKKLVAGGRGREGKEKPAAEPRHFTSAVIRSGRYSCFLLVTMATGFPCGVITMIMLACNVVAIL